VRAAHLPAYRAQGLVAHGVFDVRTAAARALARDFAIPRIAKSLAHAAQLALEVEGVFDASPCPPTRCSPCSGSFPTARWC
jgi:predicted dehydrogenase